MNFKNAIGWYIEDSRKSFMIGTVPVLDFEFEESKKDGGQDRKFGIFFNTYSRSGLNHTERANEIIESQLKTINSQPSLSSANIYYTRFGDLGWEWPKAECERSRRQCIEIFSQEVGDEMMTLQSLYESCIRKENDYVIYIHSKGTFTDSKNNNYLRNLLMKSVVSDECIHSFGDDSCDTCSAQLLGINSHYPGNMWAGKCDYISKLIPPKEFERKKREVWTRMMNATEKHEGTKFYRTIFDDGKKCEFHENALWQLERPSWSGIGRYASEHWIGGHPDLKPCEVLSLIDGNPLISYKRNRYKAGDLEVTPILRRAPGGHFWDFWKAKFRLHQWYRKQGRILEYKALYSKVPDQSSWFEVFWNTSKDELNHYAEI